MKNKKKIVITLVLLLMIVLFIIGGVFFFKKRNNNPDIITNPDVNVIKVLNYEDTKFSDKYGEISLLKNNSTTIFLDNKGEKVLELNDLKSEHMLVYNTNSSTLVVTSDLYRIYDKNFKQVIESKERLVLLGDEFNNVNYYVKENDLYNLNNELVYENLSKGSIDDFSVELAGDYILVMEDENFHFIDIKTKQEYKFSNYDNYDEYFILFMSDSIEDKRKGIYVIDKKNNRMEKYDYYEKRSYGQIVYNEKETSKKLLSDNQIINYGDLLEVKGYKFDYTVCEDGFKVYDKEDNLISDTCYGYYFVERDKYILLTKFSEELSETYYLANGKISEYIPVGKYYVDENLKIYNDKEEELENSCKAYFEYYKDDMYLCGDGKSKYLVDESFNKISESYDDIYCNDNGCKTSRDNKEGLILGDEVILEPLYNYISIDDDNLVIIDEAFGNKVLLLGEGEAVSKEEISKPIEPYTNVDVNSIIDKNELEDISDIINENNELFKKYAYLVERNKKLGNYKKYVYDYFAVVVKNKEYLDESYFFQSLRDLYIVDRTNEVNLEFSGIYYDEFIKIDIFQNWDEVIYHELMHFIDFRLNKDDLNGYYLYNDKYINNKEYMNLPVKEQDKATWLGGMIPNFLTEGGAEINSAMYLDNNFIRVYITQVNVYSILSYIYGNDFMNEVYFSKNGYLKLFQKFIEAGYSYKDYEKFMNYTDYYYENKTEKMFVDFYDMLIKLYECEKDGNWYDDKILTLLIKSGLDSNGVNPNYSSRYEEYKKIKFSYITLNEGFNKKYADDYNLDIIEVLPPALLYNGSLYATFSVYSKDSNSPNNKSMYSIVKYDVDTGELSDYKYTEIYYKIDK